MTDAPIIRTALWFDDKAEEAARAYVALLPGSRIEHVYPKRGDPHGGAFYVLVNLLGQRYSFLNGGPHFKMNPAASIEVQLDTQAEVDRLWDALLDGGTAMQCGWLTDRWGVTWQIIPKVLMSLLLTTDDTVAGRVTAAMMTMIKLDGPALEAAARG
jgi:predicted 3-demethylubiquinone-9 3-methyltransferase (glyoxalase superfamily)